jgi:hypothetical protein
VIGLAVFGGIAVLSFGLWLAFSWRANNGSLAQSGPIAKKDVHKPLIRAATPDQVRIAKTPEPVSASLTTTGSHLAQVPQQAAVVPVPAPPKVTVSLEKQAPPATQTPIQVAASDDSETQLKLENIYFRLKRPSARINGKVLYLGDRIGQARVIAIERHSVRLTVQGKTTTLEM